MVLNSFVPSGWGKEIRIEEAVPFVERTPFVMDIVCEKDAYKVSHNTHYQLQSSRTRYKLLDMYHTFTRI